MSIFSKLGEVIFTDDGEKPKEATEAVNVTPAPVGIPSQAIGIPSQMSGITMNGIVDNELMNSIKTKIDQLEPLYAQYLGLIASYETIIPDETSRIKTAVATLEKMSGITLPQIKSALERRAKLIQDENVSLEQSYQVKTGELETQRNSISDIDKEIESLQDKIRQLMADKETKLKAIAEAKAKLDTLNNNVKVTIGALVGEVTRHQNNLNIFG